MIYLKRKHVVQKAMVFMYQEKQFRWISWELYKKLKDKFVKLKTEIGYDYGDNQKYYVDLNLKRIRNKEFIDFVKQHGTETLSSTKIIIKDFEDKYIDPKLYSHDNVPMDLSQVTTIHLNNFIELNPIFNLILIGKPPGIPVFNTKNKYPSLDINTLLILKIWDI